MDLGKTSVETRGLRKMDIIQLFVVLRILLTGRAKNMENGQEDGIPEAPVHLSLSLYGGCEI